MISILGQRSQYGHYERIARVNVRWPVTGLGLSLDGSLIGIGTAAGLAIYRGEAQLSVPAEQPMLRAVLTIEWVPAEINDLVIYGTQAGWISILSNAEDANAFLMKSQYRAATSGRVISLATHTMSSSCLRIAAGISDGVIVINEYDFKGGCAKLYSIAIENAIPQALAFEADGHQLLLIGKDNGRMKRVDLKHNQVLSEIYISPNVGSAAFHAGKITVDTIADGFSLYRTGTGELLHTFKTPKFVKGLAVQVCFTGTGRWLVGGSDHGLVYVFDAQQLCVQDAFFHGGLVTHVKTADFAGGNIIACAADTEVPVRWDNRGGILSEMPKPSHVTIWKSMSSGSSRSPKIVTHFSVTSWMYRIFALGCICSTVFVLIKHFNPGPQVGVRLVKTPMVTMADDYHPNPTFKYL